ncbi:hypothetical protein [Paenisporosarcina indica]|uniref:hypothetical protein n=1 Tax=Paenisporosarcina indica TaxID=650093 RepID=UPI0009502FC7|nr:hypothetical protein [Paenisporosarcina indica]
MSNNKWSEQKIDDLLSQAPKLQDTRSKDEVFKRLSEDPRLKTQVPKKRTTWIPSAVAAAAVLTLCLFTATMLNQPNESAEMAKDQGEVSRETSSQDSSEDASMTMMKVEEAEITEGSSDEMIEAKLENEHTFLSKASTGNQLTAVYPDEVTDDVTVFRLGMAGDAANSVPVTFLIPNSQIAADFGDRKPTSLELYQTYAPRIDEESLGFTDYHPYKGSFSVQGDSLHHTLPKDHAYDTASGTITVFFQSLSETFHDYSQIEFLNEDGTNVEFDQAGEPSKPTVLDGTINHSAYYLFRQSNKNVYLTPNFGQSSISLSEALLQMKEKPNDVYESVIPEGVNFEVKNAGDITQVVFSQPLDLEKMNAQTATYLIEGLLLTGASFGESLQFENIVQPNWNGFDFTKPLPMPLGANESPFLLKE